MPLITREGKGSKLTIQEMDGNLTYLESLGLAGANYVFVSANGTPTENAAQLQAAYDLAKTMSPSSANTITIIASPGYYNFGSSTFTMDTQYIDLVSLDGNRSVIFNSSNSNGTIQITANDVFVKGVDVQDKNFTIASNLNLLRVENCKGGDYSFGGDDTFGSNPITVSGTFTNCQGGLGSFGYVGTASGTFSNCIGGESSFGGGGNASGTFTDCQGGNSSFGSFNIADGIFNNCETGYGGFGFYGTASGTFVDCKGGNSSFANSGIASGTFIKCTAGDESFGTYGTASGLFTNCIGGGIGSFGQYGELSGKLYYCRLTAGTFPTVSPGGRTYYCVDGNGNTNNQ